MPLRHRGWATATEVPVEGGTGRAVVSPAASTLRDEMAVSAQRLLAASGQIPMAAHKPRPNARHCGGDKLSEERSQGAVSVLTAPHRDEAFADVLRSCLPVGDRGSAAVPAAPGSSGDRHITAMIFPYFQLLCCPNRCML